MISKYQKYKNKYLDLKNKYIQLGGSVEIIHKATEEGINISGCENTCYICYVENDEYPLDQKIILNCQCCVHTSCILDYVKTSIGDKYSLGPNGVKCFNSTNGMNTCSQPEVNITPDDLEILFQRYPDINLNQDGAEIIDLGHFKEILAQKNTVMVVDQAQLDPYILATTKKCPICQFGVTRYHGHDCHHISPGSGCPNCHQHFCYVCLSSGEKNLRERENVAACECTWKPKSDWLQIGIPLANWTSWCGNDIKEENISYTDGVPRDIRCGCVFCPECRPGRACSDCNGTCVVCKGLVKQGLTELYRPEMGLWCLQPLRELYFYDISNIQHRLFGNKKTVSSLTFRNCNFPIIKKDLLSSFVNLTNLEFDNCNIKSIEKDSFKDLTNLIELKITNTSLKEIPNTINQCRNLNILNLSNNKIEVINKNKFPISLTKLVLTNNKIHAIDDNAFINLSSLELLELSQNKIVLVKPEYFTHLSQLIILNLSNNNIRNVNPLSFSNMDSLFLVNISGNSLRTIEQNTFINLRNINRIYLNGNKINRIGVAAFNNCRSLKVIELMNNTYITGIQNSFRMLPRLKFIRISNRESYIGVRLPGGTRFVSNLLHR